MKKIYLVFGCIFAIVLFFLFFKRENSDLVQITLKGKNSSVSYFVEIADTAEKAEMGLMWRKSMPQNQGMLFIFPYPSIIKMWMKNTYIPLDMIFFNAQNQVICLRENAVPLDDKNIISCPYPASKVLELNAGEIKGKNIQLGDKLSVK